MRRSLAVAILSGVWLFGAVAGWIFGRQMPAHHFERFGNTSYLLDPGNGRVCDPMPKFIAPSIYEQQGVTPGAFPPPPPGFTIVPIKDAYPPPCGK